MILTLAIKFRKPIAAFMAGALYAQLCVGEGIILPRDHNLPESRHRKVVQLFSEQPKQQVSAAAPISVLETPDVEVNGATVPEPFNGGPTQPEMSSFKSVSASNMVDLFSGDFSYNIPL